MTQPANPRPFSWAELEWMEYCARHAIPISRCAAVMGRDIRVVMQRAKRVGLRFVPAKHTGGRARHPDAMVRSDRARYAAVARWSRQGTSAAADD